MFGFSLDRLKDAISLRDLGYIALAAPFCGFVLFLDIRTSSDITEAFLTPLAFIAIYPVRRNWATFLTAVLALGTVILGGWFEDEGEAFEAMLFNRGMAVPGVLRGCFLVYPRP